jgi:anti-anti-sigma factor
MCEKGRPQLPGNEKKRTEELRIMQLSEIRRGDVLIVELKGRLDAETSKGVHDKLADLIERGERRLVLDGSELLYVSSSGLKVLLQASKRLAHSAGNMVLCSLSDRIRRVLDIAGFSLFLIYDSQEEATQELREWQKRSGR